MKKKSFVLLTAFTLCLLSMLHAQETSTTTVTNSNPGGIIIKGGLNLANISVKDNGDVNDSKALTTFQVGVLADIPIASVLSFQPGLLLNGKGAKTEYYADNSNRDDNYVKAKFNPLYLEVPANFVFKLPVDANTRFFVGAGPYGAIGIAGKSKVDTKLLGVSGSSEDNIKFNDDDPTTSGQEGARFDRVKRFDYGLNALAGVELGKAIIGVNYGLGLAKINSTSSDNNDDKNKYRTFTINLGIRL